MNKTIDEMLTAGGSSPGQSTPTAADEAAYRKLLIAIAEGRDTEEFDPSKTPIARTADEFKRHVKTARFRHAAGEKLQAAKGLEVQVEDKQTERSLKFREIAEFRIEAERKYQQLNLEAMRLHAEYAQLRSDASSARSQAVKELADTVGASLRNQLISLRSTADAKVDEHRAVKNDHARDGKSSELAKSRLDDIAARIASIELQLGGLGDAEPGRGQLSGELAVLRNEADKAKQVFAFCLERETAADAIFEEAQNMQDRANKLEASFADWRVFQL